MKPSPSLAALTMLFLLGCSGAATDELGASADGGSRLDAATGNGAGEDQDSGLDAASGSGLDAAVSSPDAAAADDASTAADDASAGADAAVANSAFTSDFEGSLPAQVDPGTGTLTAAQGFAPYGPAGNTFGETFLRSATANVVTLTLADLPPHSSLTLGLLFAAIDSLDGTGSFPAGDFFTISLDGEQIFRESFANATADQIQSYVPPQGVELARRVDLGFQGPGGYYTDSAYDLGQDPAFQNIPHSASGAVLTFTLEGSGVQTLDDESWAIDNVRVLLGDTPRASTDAGL